MTNCTKATINVSTDVKKNQDFIMITILREIKHSNVVRK